MAGSCLTWNNGTSGKLPAAEKCANMHVNTSQGEGDETGPWNSGVDGDRIDDLAEVMPVDGGDCTATVKPGCQREDQR